MVDVKSHPFFRGIDWNKLVKKRITPPYKPSMREINFSREFTSIPVTFNFEEEITRNDIRLSQADTLKEAESPNKYASTFGDGAGQALKKFTEEVKLSISAAGRKHSEPKARINTTMNFLNFTKDHLENPVSSRESVSELSDSINDMFESPTKGK